MITSARACAALLALATAGGAQGQGRYWLSEVELEGPLERAVLDCGAAGCTELEGPLARGERRRLTVPLPLAPPLGASSLSALPAPSVRVVDTAGGAPGSAGWLGHAERQPDLEWSRLSPALRARPRPPAAGRGPSVPRSALLCVLAGAALALALGAETPLRWRRRAARGLVLVASALAAAWLVRRPAGEPLLVRVLEGDREVPLWLRVEASARALELLPAAPPLRIETAVEGAELVYTVDLARGSTRAEAAGGLIRFDGEPAPAAGGVAQALSPAWFRSAEGAWTRYEEVEGGWGAAKGSPAAGAADADPPGWLRAGLPPGRTALLGRVRSQDGSDVVPSAAPSEWIRVTGADPPEALPPPPREPTEGD